MAHLGIGRQRHHVRPYAEYGHAGPLVPICSNCHELVTWLQKTVRKFDRPGVAVS